MNNMDLYNKYRTVPETAQKTITGGRLNGMTDINPMWRIQCLTEAFGPCGIGWTVRVMNTWIEDGASGEKVAWVKAHLYIKNGEEWSEPIEGIGGSMFVSNERGGLRTSDEAFKMAYTDAISVACKMLGIGADVYWSAGRTKYTKPEPAEEPVMYVCQECGEVIKPHSDGKNEYGVMQIAEMTKKRYGKPLCWDCAIAAKKAKSETDG